MTALFHGAALFLAAAMFLSLFRAIRGPSHFDRLTGAGLTGSKTVVLLVVLGSMSGRVDLYVDIALTYALVSFIGTLALAKFFERGGNCEP